MPIGCTAILDHVRGGHPGEDPASRRNRPHAGNDWGQVVAHARVPCELPCECAPTERGKRGLPVNYHRICRRPRSVLFNFLGRDFFNYLSEKDVENFTMQLYRYLGGFVVGIPVFVLRDFFLVGARSRRTPPAPGSRPSASPTPR